MWPYSHINFETIFEHSILIKTSAFVQKIQRNLIKLEYHLQTKMYDNDSRGQEEAVTTE